MVDVPVAPESFMDEGSSIGHGQCALCNEAHLVLLVLVLALLLVHMTSSSNICPLCPLALGHLACTCASSLVPLRHVASAAGWLSDKLDISEGELMMAALRENW